MPGTRVAVLKINTIEQISQSLDRHSRALLLYLEMIGRLLADTTGMLPCSRRQKTSHFTGAVLTLVKSHSIFARYFGVWMICEHLYAFTPRAGNRVLARVVGRLAASGK